MQVKATILQFLATPCLSDCTYLVLQGLLFRYVVPYFSNRGFTGPFQFIIRYPYPLGYILLPRSLMSSEIANVLPLKLLVLQHPSNFVHVFLRYMMAYLPDCLHLTCQPPYELPISLLTHYLVMKDCLYRYTLRVRLLISHFFRLCASSVRLLILHLRASLDII